MGGVKKTTLAVLAASTVFLIAVNWPAIAGAADRHEGLAAWAQALGVFIAVYWSGRLSLRQASDAECARVKRQLSSTGAVIAKALWAAENVESGLLLPAAGMLARDPVSMLVICSEALTPMRIHELPDSALVTIALEIKSDLRDLVIWLLKNQTGLDLAKPGARLPLPALDKIERVRRGSQVFIAFSARWQKNN